MLAAMLAAAPMTDRNRLTLGLLVFVHVYIGWVLCGYPPIVPVNVARSTLLLTDVALIVLYFVASPSSMKTRFALSIIGVAWVFALAFGYKPSSLAASYHWRMWISIFGAASVVVAIGLFRPQFRFRCRRDRVGFLNASVGAVFGQLLLQQVSTLPAHVPAPPQFSLRHIFYVCTATALLLLIRRWLLDQPLYLFAEYIMPGLVGLAAIRASLARTWCFFKCVAALAFAAALGEGTWWLLARMHDWGMVSESLILTASLLVVRSCGYRLVSGSDLNRLNS